MAQVEVPIELPVHADCHKQPEMYIGPLQLALQVMLRPMTFQTTRLVHGYFTDALNQNRIPVTNHQKLLYFQLHNQRLFHIFTI